MLRKTFYLTLNAGCEVEYKRRHDEIWPELVALLKEHGVHNYSISLARKTNQLFGYAEIESEQQWNDIANSPICQKWWKYMSDIMATNDDHSPVAVELCEMFYLE